MTENCHMTSPLNPWNLSDEKTFRALKGLKYNEQFQYLMQRLEVALNQTVRSTTYMQTEVQTTWYAGRQSVMLELVDAFTDPKVNPNG